MITAIFFDLDTCLSAADEPGRALFEPAFEAIRQANQGTLPDAALARAIAECWRFPFDDVARRHGFSEAMREAGFRAFGRIEIPVPMKGYGDLEVLGALPVRRFLVTTGFRRLQESKIRALGIGALFEGICIDAIDEPGPKGKERIFRELLARHALRTDEVLVVGDNPDSEIAAGNRLGLRTVQTLRPGVLRGDNATHHVTGLAELHALL